MQALIFSEHEVPISKIRIFKRGLCCHPIFYPLITFFIAAYYQVINFTDIFHVNPIRIICDEFSIHTNGSCGTGIAHFPYRKNGVMNLFKEYERYETD